MTDVFCDLKDCKYNDEGVCTRTLINIDSTFICGQYEQINSENFRVDSETV